MRVPVSEDEILAYQDHKYIHVCSGIAPLPAGECSYCDLIVDLARRDLANERRPAGIAPYGAYELPEILKAERDAQRREWLADSQDCEEAALDG